MTVWFLVLQGKDRKDVCGKYGTACGDVQLLQNNTVETDSSASFRLLLHILVVI